MSSCADKERSRKLTRSICESLQSIYTDKERSRKLTRKFPESMRKFIGSSRKISGTCFCHMSSCAPRIWTAESVVFLSILYTAAAWTSASTVSPFLIRLWVDFSTRALSDWSRPCPSSGTLRMKRPPVTWNRPGSRTSASATSIEAECVKLDRSFVLLRDSGGFDIPAYRESNPTMVLRRCLVACAFLRRISARTWLWLWRFKTPPIESYDFSTFLRRFFSMHSLTDFGLVRAWGLLEDGG